jgi:hypothetical protein
METGQAVQTSQSAAPGALQPMTKPKSIGGWLLFFCLGTILFTPLTLLKEAVGSKLLQVHIVDGVLICASLAAGIAVATVSNKAKLFVRIYFLFWLIMGGRFLLNVLTAEELDITRILLAVRPTLYVVVWALYFRSSKRVKETFGENW